MARTVGRGRTIEEKQRLPKYKLPQEIAPQELVFFNPPKGIDVTTPLSKLPRESSPLITNLLLNRGVLRSRNGVEKYHNGDGSLRIQRTTDLVGTAGQTAPQITDRSTASQSNNGWHDPDGVLDNKNQLTQAVMTAGTVTAANRLYNSVGDPAAGNNVDAYDDIYLVPVTLVADTTGITFGTAYTFVTSLVQVEYSTDGGTNWNLTTASASLTRDSTQANGVSTQGFTLSVNVPGSPTSLLIRLILTVTVTSTGTPATGNGVGSVSVTPAVTWKTSSTLAVADRVPIRWTESHIQTYDDATDVSAAWTTAYTYPASQVNNDSLLPSYVWFGDKIISTDIGNTTQVGAGSRIGSQGLVSSLISSPHTTAILAKSPRAAHLAVFGNRVIASRTNDWTALTDPWVESATNLARVRWCVKNDATDWIGIGSGFEDMPVPDGSLDEVMGVYPVSDVTAIVVSQHTMRRMDVTNFVDAPFAFGLLTDQIGTLSRYTIRAIPGGVIFLGYDDVYVVTLGDVKRIGTSALRNSVLAIANPRLATGYIDIYNSRYVLIFKEGSTQVIWVYSFVDSGWTRYTLPFDVAFVDFAFFKISGALYYGMYFTMSIAGGFSCRDNPTRTQDVDSTGADVDSPIEARTGLVLTDSALHKVQLVEVQMVYESTGSQTVLFDYSTDGGQTWNPYSSQNIVATSGPTVLSVRTQLERTKMQIRVRSPKLGGLTIVSLHAFAVRGALIKA